MDNMPEDRIRLLAIYVDGGEPRQVGVEFIADPRNVGPALDELRRQVDAAILALRARTLAG